MPKGRGGKGGKKGAKGGKKRSSAPAVSAKGQLGKGILRRQNKDQIERRRQITEGGADVEQMGLSTAGSRLISVTETSTVEDFMAAAAMSDRSFAAERKMYGQHDELVMLGDDGEVVAMGAGAAAEAAKPDVTGESGVMPLQVPRRPAWEEGMAAGALHKLENKSFLAWRRSLADLEEEHTSSIASGAGGELGGVAVTPFEKNIEMWRQLWRVIERSDVVVQVVDARQPLLYRCPDLESYAKETNSLKQNLLLVNKADFLSARQRFEWGAFLQSQGVRFAFFSAHAELKKLEEEARHTAQVGVDVFVALEHGADLRGADEDGASDAASFAGSAGSEAAGDSVAGGSGGSGSSLDGEADDPSPQPQPRPGSTSVVSPPAASADRAGAVAAETADHDDAAAYAAASGIAIDGGAGDGESIGGKGGQTRDGDGLELLTGGVSQARVSPERRKREAAEAAAREREEAEESAAARDLKVSPEMRAACRVLTREELLDFLRDEFAWLRAHVTAGQTTAKAAARLAEEAAKAKRRQDAIDAAEAAADALGGFSAEALADPAMQPQVDDEEEGASAVIVSARTAVDEEPAAGTGPEGGNKPKGKTKKRVGFAPPPTDEEGGETAEGGRKIQWAPDVSDTAAASEALAELEGRKLIIGTVGYPNVGKSSVINALLGVTASSHRQKRAGVGATPGKTKHFQTLALSDDMTLCDCPGLVFPSFVSTRAEMVVAGVLPVDEMRQHYPPVSLVCNRVPRATLERKYGIKIRKPGMAEDPTRTPHARELLDALCHMRGFMASTHAGPDHPRGSRLVLKDFLSGALLYVHPPPGLPALRAQRFLSDTSADRAVVLGGEQAQDSTGAVAAAAKSSSGIGWVDNVLLPSAAGAGGTLPGHPAGPAAVAEAATPAGGADSDMVDMPTRAGEETGPGLTDAEVEALIAEDALLFGDIDAEGRAGAAAAAMPADARGAGGEEGPGVRRKGGRRNRIKGMGKRRLRKGERDPDPYGTQVTEEEMLLGVVDQTHKATAHARARQALRGATSGVDARVMSGSASTPDGVGAQTTFTRVGRVFDK